jgi:hypothetical protein
MLPWSPESDRKNSIFSTDQASEDACATVDFAVIPVARASCPQQNFNDFREFVLG